MVFSPTRRKWRAVAASEVGAAHVHTDTPCQDSSRCHVETSTLIACVADGAGSARFGQQGSQVAVDTFVTVSKELVHRRGYDPEQMICEAFGEARRAVSDIAPGESREYATTLLGLIVAKNRFAAGQIGDGAIVVDGEVVVESHKGEYANETSFITSCGAEPDIYSAKAKVKRVAMVTDGLEHLSIQVNEQQRVPHGPFFNPLFEWLKETDEPDRGEQLSEFLRSDAIRSRTGDDVTLLLAMR